MIQDKPYDSKVQFYHSLLFIQGSANLCNSVHVLLRLLNFLGIFILLYIKVYGELLYVRSANLLNLY